jgi:prepilin-type N-terminal cleavage/methylation domain-containing protein
MFIVRVKSKAILDTGYSLLAENIRQQPASRSIRNRLSRVHHSGFTLLEITLAVAILAMMSLAIFRFVQSNLVALRASSEYCGSNTKNLPVKAPQR